jgi:hypothetical protein
MLVPMHRLLMLLVLWLVAGCGGAGAQRQHDWPYAPRTATERVAAQRFAAFAESLGTKRLSPVCANFTVGFVKQAYRCEQTTRPATPDDLRGMDVLTDDVLVYRGDPDELLLAAPIVGEEGERLFLSFSRTAHDPQIRWADVGGAD